MGLRTKKVGITGKYGPCYGASLRKQIRKIEAAQHSRFTCPFYGKDAVKRASWGIWHCTKCKHTIAGGAYALSTPSAVTARSTIRRLREVREN